jgi:zinc protease
MRKAAVIIFFFAACLVCCADADALEVRRTVMPNGLVILHSENHTLPIVTVTIVVKAGQLNEPPEKGGLAHLHAEMLTEGTATLSSKAISEEMDFIGASLDASAGHDFITITLAVLKKDVEKGFQICADILMNPAFHQDEVERKKDRIKGFLKRQEEEPSFLAGRAFREAVFGAYPYGRRIGGSPESIDRIGRGDLVSFHAANFLPNNAIFSLVGDLTPKEVTILTEKYFGRWEKMDVNTYTPAKTITAAAGQVIRIEKDLTQANIVAGTRGISREDPDYYTFSVLNYILGGGGFSSRLMHSIRDEKGLAYDVHSLLSPYKRAGLFVIEAQTKNESANTVIHEIFREVTRLREAGVSDEEIRDAQSYLAGSFKRRLDTNGKIASFLASVELFNLGFDYVEKYPEYIYSVTKEDIRRVAGKYLDPANFVLVVVADQEKAGIQDALPSPSPLLQGDGHKPAGTPYPE